ncbi:MAG: nitrogenase component 1 [Chloroflexi bacterium]|nr:nitrogenase component 1 [Chloroflexota bacterium]
MATVLSEAQAPCMTLGAMEAMDAIKESLVLVHSPPGCVAYLNTINAVGRGRKMNLKCTLLSENDVIFGAEDKAKAYIRQADRQFEPRVMAVLNACASKTIGEDIEDIVQQVQYDVNAKLIAVPTCGYEGDLVDGYRMALERLVDALVEEPETREENSINLLGYFSDDSNLEEIERLIKELGLHIRCVFTSGTTLEDIQRASQASLGVLLCEPAASSIAHTMKERWGVPYVGHDSLAPYGFEATATWLREIARATGREKEVEALIARESAVAREEVARLDGQLKGKRVAIVAAVERAIALTNFLCELGVEPILVGTSSGTSEQADELLQKVIREKGINPQVNVHINLFQIEEVLKEDKPDLLLGGSSWNHLALADMYNVPLVPVAIPVEPLRVRGSEPFMGFRGIPTLVKELLQGLREGNRPMYQLFEDRLRDPLSRTGPPAPPKRKR